ncbi:hypothetical protein ACE4RR_20785 [Alteribacillus sp. HJP-4]
MEYKIKHDKVTAYEEHMKKIAAHLRSLDASNFQWFTAADQPGLYVEMFEVPALSHYHTLKKQRCSKEHELFGKLDDYVDGGMNKVHCWAFHQKQITSKVDY